jgi:hypothetical protein
MDIVQYTFKLKDKDKNKKIERYRKQNKESREYTDAHM